MSSGGEVTHRRRGPCAFRPRQTATTQELEVLRAVDESLTLAIRRLPLDSPSLVSLIGARGEIRREIRERATG